MWEEGSGAKNLRCPEIHVVRRTLAREPQWPRPPSWDKLRSF
jgi:hypothetical protein